MTYLSQRALAGLKAYTYKPTGYTLLDTLHNPFFECETLFCMGHAGCSRNVDDTALNLAGSVQQLPMWLAPNLVTLLGTMALLVAYLINTYYTPDFVGGHRCLLAVLCVRCFITHVLLMWA
jgi:hypothetical protein